MCWCANTVMTDISQSSTPTEVQCSSTTPRTRPHGIRSNTQSNGGGWAYRCGMYVLVCYVYIYVCMYVCMCIYMLLCMHVFMHPSERK